MMDPKQKAVNLVRSLGNKQSALDEILQQDGFNQIRVVEKLETMKEEIKKFIMSERLVNCPECGTRLTRNKDTGRGECTKCKTVHV